MRASADVAVLAAVAVVVVGTASAFGVRALILDKGFIGLPPQGATPSAPESGTLVVSAYVATGGGRTKLWMYEDGRLIWQREAVWQREGQTDFPQAANWVSTGLLEQRLTPEGVELLRSEILASGLFERDLALIWFGPCFNYIRVGDEDPHVVTWHGFQCLQETPTLPVDAHYATAEQQDALADVIRRLTDPGEWLPKNAWRDRTIRAYVPSRFAIVYGGPRSMDAAAILDLLPRRAQDLLRQRQRTRFQALFRDGQLVRVLDDSDLEVDQRGRQFVLSYVGKTVHVTFEPILPHGEWTCSACG